ncbi:hypothetical protein [Kitasatospora sp. NPDC005856]|uniref:hypothetical protein n=1 Tax=Kitasatospora sp. NPDC005856 TaxID=3154566 RepID=UPI0033E6C91F
MELTPGESAGLPGVRVLGVSSSEPLKPQRVTVALPPEGFGLRWGTASGPEYVLVVAGGSPYVGQLSMDGQSIAFEDVALAAPGEETLLSVPVWVGWEYNPGNPVSTFLQFAVGDQTSRSTTITIKEAVEE